MSLPNATRRARSFVDPEVQGGLLKKVAFHWLILFIVNSLALIVWVRMFEQPEATWAESFGDTARRFLPFFVVSALLIPAFVWDTLKITNRFAGPIFRLRVALGTVARGQTVEPLCFRNSDFWQEIAEDFNKIVSQKNSAS